MPMASTIVIAREDFSIPGSESGSRGPASESAELERRFFELLRENRPDVVVLDLTTTAGKGVEAIRKIREQSGVPILVVCAADNPNSADYRIAGSAECLFAPVDIGQLNSTIQNIIRLTKSSPAPRRRSQDAYSFAGVTYRPDQNALRGPNGLRVKLTTSENDLLSHFLTRSWTVCSRAEIANVVYGEHRPVNDRAIDVLVNRLRKKLVSACGENAENLVKTEFRRGYMLVAEVSTVMLQGALEEAPQ
jgi:DNA-binding response OmpR family regulator